jgi:general secretion pathway protein D
MSTEQFIKTVTELLQTEGVDVGRTTQKQENLVFVPITQLGSVAVFSAEKELLQRVEYWAEKIDQPTKGNEKQYHIYTPRFARASDLGESIAPLISGNKASQSRPTNNAKDNKNSSLITNNKPVNTSVSNEKMSMVIDQRSNTLIFHSSGVEYQSLLPLIHRMDILPKQVLLSVTIAEVTLQGIFKRGFEYAVTSGKFGASTKGAFGLEAITGISLNWASGLNEVMADFVEENSYVNILSKPSILVRDGTEATINVGDRVPVSSGSSTAGSGDRITENITYRETGIKLKVAPTVNAQGVVIMTITQDISNEVADQAGKGGNPIFFERNITTEVVADSGQTILLGGLISDNQSNSDKGVPFIKSIPILGALFESESKTNTKTELVIMVTPKIVERSDQWQGILNSFEQVLENINLVD